MPVQVEVQYLVAGVLVSWAPGQVVYSELQDLVRGGNVGGPQTLKLITLA